MWKVSLPLRVLVTRRKYFSLNLNHYRNAHYQTLAKSKRLFKDLIYDQIKNLPKFHKVLVVYVLHPRTKTRCDVSNICSIVDKYFCDCLTELGKLQDDNYKFVPIVIYKIGKVDPLNPRVDVTIINLED